MGIEVSPIINKIQELRETIAKKKDLQEPLDMNEAAFIIESILDTLIEVGNGVSVSDLHDAADDLFQFREYWFKNQK